LLLTAGLLKAPFAIARAVPATLTLTEYHTALLKGRTLALAAERGRSSPFSTEIRDRILTSLPMQTQVRMPGGRVVDVDNRPLAVLLGDATAPEGRAFPQRRGWPRPSIHAAGRWRRFVAAVDSILAATASPTLAAARPDAARVLRQVLSRPEYQYEEPKPTLVERFFGWLGRQIERFFLWLARLIERLFPGSDRSPGHTDRLARMMVIGVVLLLAALIARIVLALLPNLRRLRRGDEEEPSGGELMLPREPDALLAEADHEAAAGRYREALRLAYLATVARLDRAGVLPEDRSRTHWELLRDLRRISSDELRVMSDEKRQPESSLITHHSSLITLLSPLTQRLDERLYGGRTATAEDYQACRAAHDQIERLLCAPA
jgi:hypothetical protein